MNYKHNTNLESCFARPNQREETVHTAKMSTISYTKPVETCTDSSATQLGAATVNEVA